MANILAAVKQVNPTVEGAIEGNTEGGLAGAAKGAAKSVLGAAGVKSGRDVFKDNLARVLDAHDQLQLAIKAKDADQVKALAADPMASKKLAEAAQKTETFINKLKAKVADPKTTDADRVVAQKQIQQLKDRFNEAVERVLAAKHKK
jgi:predicted RecB family endonuclease